MTHRDGRFLVGAQQRGYGRNLVGEEPATGARRALPPISRSLGLVGGLLATRHLLSRQGALEELRAFAQALPLLQFAATWPDRRPRCQDPTAPCGGRHTVRVRRLSTAPPRLAPVQLRATLADGHDHVHALGGNGQVWPERRLDNAPVEVGESHWEDHAFNSSVGSALGGRDCLAVEGQDRGARWVGFAEASATEPEGVEPRDEDPRATWCRPSPGSRCSCVHGTRLRARPAAPASRRASACSRTARRHARRPTPSGGPNRAAGRRCLRSSGPGPGPSPAPRASCRIPARRLVQRRLRGVSGTPSRMSRNQQVVAAVLEDLLGDRPRRRAPPRRSASPWPCSVPGSFSVKNTMLRKLARRKAMVLAEQVIALGPCGL